MDLNYVKCRGAPRSADVSYVYFIQHVPTGKIEIGTTDNIQRRFSQIRNAIPDGDIELLGAIEGGKELERRLHDKFKHLVYRNEWFNPELELYYFITGQPQTFHFRILAM
jgi:T5orf172 domain